MNKQFKPGDAVIVDAGLGITKNGNIQRIAETVAYVKHYNGSVVGYKYDMIKPVVMAEQAQKPYGVGLTSELSMIQSIMERKLTPAELKKREEVATAMERENPGMDMSKKMAIATATAKKVAEDTEQIDEKLTDDAKQKINTALGPKFANNTLRKTSGPARAIIGLAKTNPDNIVKKEKVMAEGRGDTVLKTSASNMDDNEVHIRKLKDAGLHASQGSGASNHIIVPPEHAEKARKILGAHLKEDMHYCAKHVFSERFGEGLVVEGSHAEPTVEGLIEWYDVDFGGTVRRVMTEKVKVMHAEYHMNHKKKMKEEEEVEEAKSHTVPKTAKEKDLAALAEPKDKITHADVMVGRGVKKEEVELDESIPARGEVKPNPHLYTPDKKHSVIVTVSKDGKKERRRFTATHNLGREETSRRALATYTNKGYKVHDFQHEEVEFEEGFENLPGKATHLTKVDVRHPEHGIISGSTTLRHLGGNKYEVRAGRAKGKTIALDNKHVQKLSMEEVEQLDELSKGTLASYVKKAVGGDSGENRNNLVNTIRRRTGNAHTSVNSDAERDASIKQANKDDQNFTNRVKGIRKATDRLAKEEVEQVESDLNLTEGLAVHGKYVINTGPVIKGMGEGKPDHVKAQKTKLKAIDVKADRDDKDGRYGTTHRVTVTNKETGDITHHHVYHSDQSGNKPIMSVRSVGAARKNQDEHHNVLKDYLSGKKPTTKPVQEEVELDEAMISYSDFQSKIKAHQKAGNQIKDDKYDKKKASYTVIDQEGTAKKITHTDSGVSQQHLGSVKRDDDESSETKPTEKRGRGRPAGSKSGARN